jgi:acetyl esterase/lipase
MRYHCTKSYKNKTKMKKLYLIATLFILVQDHTFAQNFPTPTYANISYINDNQNYHKLDVYIPANASTKKPTIIYIHPGGWNSGDRLNAMPRGCDTLLQEGFVICSISYRFSQDSVFPAQLYDCKAAIRYLKQNASSFKIDTCRMGVFGHSSGGHLAALVATTIGVDSLEGRHLGYNAYSSKVHAAAIFFAPIDFLNYDTHFPAIAPDSCAAPLYIQDDINSISSQLLGCRVSTCPSRVRAANPTTYINGNEPPFTIFHGTFDCIVPPNQSQILYDSLQAHGQKATVAFYPGETHGGAARWYYRQAPKDSVLQFFNRNLKAINPCGNIGTTQPSPNIALRYSIYPNPTQNTAHLRLHYTQALPQNIRIYNPMGATLWLKNQPEIQTYDYNIDALPAGIYFVKITYADGAATQKIVVQ